MLTAIIAILVAMVLGIGIGWLITRKTPSAAVVPDPVVLQEYAAKRAALQKEAPRAEALTLADAAAALRNMASR